MKLKYYLRGLGIGILVTAVIMGVTQGSRKETLSDREIRERAAALGMVEPGNSLADLEAAETPAATEIPEAAETPALSDPDYPVFSVFSVSDILGDCRKAWMD